MEAYYKTIVEKANDAIMLIKDGSVKYANPYAGKILGCKPEEINGEEFLDFVAEEHKEKAKKSLEESVLEEETFPYEAELRKKSGETIPVEIHVRKIKYHKEEADIVFIRHIRARKKVERIFEEQEKRFQDLADNTPDIIARFDEECRYVYVNKAAEQIFGIPKKEFFWKTDEDLNLGGERAKAFKDAILSVFKNKEKKTFYSEAVIQGEKRYYYTVLLPEFFNDGEVKSVLSITRDITEIKEVDQIKSEFISITSHQLRSPLSVINWCSLSLLREDVGKINEEQKEYLGRIYESVRKLVKITDVFLNTTMIDLEMFVFSPRKTDLALEFQKIEREFEEIIKKRKIHFQKELEGSLSVKIDSRVFKIICRGLISNALDYTSKKGRVYFRMKKEEGKIFMEIGDDGCGISFGDRERIFTKFYRSETARNIKAYGTGLDLYLIKSLLAKIEGEIKLESPNPMFGKGTVFYVSIPVSD